jgi:GNAT superfamily N-acetyltransferase
MDFQYSTEQETLRRELRDWLATNLPPDLRVDDPIDERVAPERETFERRRAWQRRMWEAGWVGIAWPREWGGRGATNRHYTAPRGAFFVVRDGARVVGSVGVDRLDDDTAELHRLYLDADLRGRGLGRVLVERVLMWCRQESISRLILWSDTRFEVAHRLYERMGFVRTGERELPEDLNQTREFRYERAV